VLTGFIEKNRSLQLPEDWTHIPSCVRPVFDQALQRYTPETLQTLKTGNFFGLGEETSDMIYYLGIQAALHSGALSEERLNAFQTAARPLLAQDNQTGYDQLINLANRFLPENVVSTYQQCFPSGADGLDPQLTRNLLVMYMADFVVGEKYAAKRPNLTDPTYLSQKLTEETEELVEHLARQLTDQHPLLTTLRSFTQPVQGLEVAAIYRERFTQLVRLMQPFQSSAQFTLNNLARFGWLKSSGRTEYAYKFPSIPYETGLKPQAKAWEKLLEAQLLR
jgi:hypothetical protein